MPFSAKSLRPAASSSRRVRCLRCSRRPPGGAPESVLRNAMNPPVGPRVTGWSVSRNHVVTVKPLFDAATRVAPELPARSSITGSAAPPRDAARCPSRPPRDAEPLLQEQGNGLVRLEVPLSQRRTTAMPDGEAEAQVPHRVECVLVRAIVSNENTERSRNRLGQQ